MPNLVVDLSKFAVILWSGMLIISGSIWILSSQVRRLGDLMEQGSRTTTSGAIPMAEARAVAAIATTRTTTPHSVPLRAVRVTTRTLAAR